MNRSLDATRDLSLPGPDVVPHFELGADGQLPPVLLGRGTPEVARQVESFYRSVATMFEAWLKRSSNGNTQRTYRRSVLSFTEFLGISWPVFDDDGPLSKDSPPDESWRLLQASVADVRAWRDEMQADGQAGATLNARLSALSGFYRFMRETAATELRLPIQVPNPAHAQFIGRESADPVEPTLPLGLTKARKLMALPSKLEESEVLRARDHAVLKTFLYTGIRIGTACRLSVADFHDDEHDPTLAIQEKGRGKAKRRIGINFVAAEAIRDYLRVARLSGGPLFRARAAARGDKLAERPMSQAALYRLLLGYLERVPGAMVQVDAPKEPVAATDTGEADPPSSPTTPLLRCRYTPHSLRATTATLLDEAGVGIKKIQDLLGHKDIRVTQTYIKLGQDTRKSASHEVPL
jgi:integrase